MEEKAFAVEKGGILMGTEFFSPEEALFREMAGECGGTAVIFRREWEPGTEGEPFDREVMRETGRWEAVLSGGGVFFGEGTPVPFNRLERVMLLAAGADIRAGDQVEYQDSAFSEKEVFQVSGAPVRYPTHQEVPLKKEHRI